METTQAQFLWPQNGFYAFRSENPISARLEMAFHGLKENDDGAEGMGIVLEAMKYFQDAGSDVVLVHRDCKAV